MDKGDHMTHNQVIRLIKQFLTPCTLVVPTNITTTTNVTIVTLTTKVTIFWENLTTNVTIMTNITHLLTTNVVMKLYLLLDKHYSRKLTTNVTV